MADLYLERFKTYFEREVAEKAAHSLSNGVEMEFRLEDPTGQASEVFTFKRESGHNTVQPGPAHAPHLIFMMGPEAAEAILTDPSEDIAHIGVSILKLLGASDASKRIRFQFKAGFLTFATSGYLGVLTSGGSALASHLASMGLTGLGVIKAALKKMKQ